MGTVLVRRLLAAVFAGGLAAAGPLIAPGTATAAMPYHHGHHHGHHWHHHRDHHHHGCYQAPVQANPRVTVHKARRGSVAVVTVDHHLSGRATLVFASGHKAGVWVEKGAGYRHLDGRSWKNVSVTFPSSRKGCVNGGSYQWSGQHPKAGGQGDVATASFVNASSGLAGPATADQGAEVSGTLLGGLGAGLVAAGALSIAISRRRGRTGSPLS